MSQHPLEHIFHPHSIAVIGASEDSRSLGYHFIRHLLDYGYRGRIYPVNPKLEKVFNLKAYPALKEVPGSVDYVICCISASKVVDLLSECPSHGVKVVHLFTGRLSETGRPDAIKIEQQTLKQAKEFNLAINYFQDWRWKFISEQRRRLIDAQPPVFSSFGRAAKAMRCLVEYYQKII